MFCAAHRKDLRELGAGAPVPLPLPDIRIDPTLDPTTAKLVTRDGSTAVQIVGLADPAQAALKRALRQLDEVKSQRLELVEATFRAARDAASALHYEPVENVVGFIDRTHRTPETAVAVLADWQLGKTTPTYNSEIAMQRLARYAEGVERITQIQRTDHPVKHLRVYLLGDLVEGELIFPGQAHRIDASLFRQVVVDGPQMLGEFLRRMLQTFETVKVVGVIGNHGRVGGPFARESHPETNADAMMYEVTRIMLEKEPRLEWAPNFTPGERHWYALDEVEGKRFFLFHGDQLRGGHAGFPWYALGKAVSAWRLKFGFDYSLSGHFHTSMELDLAGGTHYGAGTLESDNTYALEEMKAWGTPAQLLLFVHPRRGISAKYVVRL